MLSREEIRKAILKWNDAWNAHDLEGVMMLFHEDIIFENWTGGRAQGKEALRQAWEPWFQNHGNFRFHEEDLFIDEGQQPFSMLSAKGIGVVRPVTRTTGASR